VPLLAPASTLELLTAAALALAVLPAVSLLAFASSVATLFGLALRGTFFLIDTLTPLF
jgi:hypothetical protein